MKPRFFLTIAAAITFSMAGCRSEKKNEVVLFCALDREFSQKQLSEFESETGISPIAKFDTESSKTVGLANLILKQGKKGKTDLFWNNEILHTLRIQKAGLTVPVQWDGMGSIPSEFRSKDGHWVGFAARARVIIVNTEKLPDDRQRPTSILDLVDPKFRGKGCIAKPLFGTTSTHMAVLQTVWGEEKTEQFLDDLKKNEVAVLSGNRQVAADVASGLYAFGLTDTDDALVEIDAGSAVAIIFPDQQKEGLGTLLIPNTIAVLKSSKNLPAAKKLVQFAVSPKNESALARGDSGQIPLGAECKAASRALEKAGITKEQLRWMKVDWNKTVDSWEKLIPLMRKKFL